LHSRLRKALKGMPGVRGFEINYLLDTAKVRYDDPNRLSLARIKAAVK
jgi:copper chaperone CopZ